MNVCVSNVNGFISYVVSKVMLGYVTCKEAGSPSWELMSLLTLRTDLGKMGH